MKKLLLSVLALASWSALVRADDVAVVSLRVGKEDRIRQFAVEFYDADAPMTVENFKKLARKGFYKGIAVHRAFAHSLVQMGDPLSKKKDRSQVGTGGPGYTIPPEIRKKHVKGALAAARLPDKINPSRVSNGSQFYICLESMPNLDGQYSVFGKVLWGLDTLDLISTNAVDSNDNPIERIEIQSIKVIPREKLPAAPPAENPDAKPAPVEKRSWWKIFG